MRHDSAARKCSRSSGRVERHRGDDASGIIEVGPACSSGVQLTQCEHFCRGSEAVDCNRRRTSKVGLRTRGGQARLLRLRVEAPQMPQDANPTVPAPPPEWAAELQRVQSIVAQSQQKRRQPGMRDVVEEVRDLRWEVDGLRQERDSLVAARGFSVGPDTTMAAVGMNSTCSDRMAAVIEEWQVKRRPMEAARTNAS